MENIFREFLTFDSLTPIDKEFIACISRLDTPKKIGAYMLENFVHYSKERKPNVHNSYRFWKIKKGDCVDFSEFGAFVANHHGYKVYQMGIINWGMTEKHLITIYVEDGGMSFTTNEDYFNNNGNYFNNFEEIKNFIYIFHPLGYIPKEFIIKSYENRTIKWSGSNYVS